MNVIPFKKPPMSWAQREKIRATVKARWNDPDYRARCTFLTPEDTKKIIKRYASGELCADIANDYLVTTNRIYQIAAAHGIRRRGAA